MPGTAWLWRYVRPESGEKAAQPTEFRYFQVWSFRGAR